MEWKDVGRVIGKAAPILGTAIGGPAGGAIGGLVSIVANKFGVKGENPDPEEVLQAIQGDPKATLKLRQLQEEHKVELARIALQQDQAYLADRQSARSRQVESERATGKRDYNLYTLAYLVVGGFFGLVGLLVFRPLPEQSTQAVFLLFGALSAGFGAVIQYFFGSSKSSQEKNVMLKAPK